MVGDLGIEPSVEEPPAELQSAAAPCSMSPKPWGYNSGIDRAVNMCKMLAWTLSPHPHGIVAAGRSADQRLGDFAAIYAQHGGE